MRWYDSQLSRCLGLLKLSWPCTVAEVKEAYRSLVKLAHPDGGGTHDEFLALQEAYEQALRMCR
jgi:curved DNA-binding protein CbpA